MNELYVKGYALSLLALIISIVIFLGFKYVRAGQLARLAYDADADALSHRSLRCTRIRIHVHLFGSLACTCIAWILWYRLVVEQTDQIAENPVSSIGWPHVLNRRIELSSAYCSPGASLCTWWCTTSCWSTTSGCSARVCICTWYSLWYVCVAREDARFLAFATSIQMQIALIAVRLCIGFPRILDEISSCLNLCESILSIFFLYFFLSSSSSSTPSLSLQLLQHLHQIENSKCHKAIQPLYICVYMCVPC